MLPERQGLSILSSLPVYYGEGLLLLDSSPAKLTLTGKAMCKSDVKRSAAWKR